MAKMVNQYRYYGEGNGKNSPINLSADTLIEGLLSNDTFILQLGVQTYPGTEMYLNNGNYPIVIGSTGIYELNVENFSQITQIQFAKASLDLINNNDNAYLIIDTIEETI